MIGRLPWVCCPLLGVCLLLASCLGRSPQARFYALAAGRGAVDAKSIGLGPRASARAAARPVVVIGPLRLPGYLDRAEIVTRRSPTQLHVGEFHCWAGPLEEQIVAVLRDSVAHALEGRAEVLGYPAPAGVKVDRRVTLQLQRFEGQFDGDAVLEASWLIRRLDGSAASAELRRTRLVEHVGSADYDGLVATLGRLVERLGQQIARHAA